MGVADGRRQAPRKLGRNHRAQQTLTNPIEPQGSGAAFSPELVLEVQHFSKSYDETAAVRDLSFTLAAGGVLGLVGPNGSGKTTTLRSIAGVLPIQSGLVRVCGHDVATDESGAKQCLTWVPDDPQPFDTLTVGEHMEFAAKLYSVPDWRPRAGELLERFELDGKRDALGGELSRGMRQKLALCCAWLPRPSLVLLDEPLSGLDPRGIRTAKQAILEQAASGTAVILSSHLLELVEAMGHRILILDEGEKRFDGTLEEARVAIQTAPGSNLEEIFFAATGKTPAAAPRAAPGADSQA